MARPRAKELTERELEVMQVFWKQGELDAVEARNSWRRPGWIEHIRPLRPWCGFWWRRDF